MPEIAISPNFRQELSDPANAVDASTGQRHLLASIQTKILLFEDRTRGWFLSVAKRLAAADNESGYAVIQIAASQVEAMQQYYEGVDGHRMSKALFVRGMKRIFSPHADRHDTELEDFYDRVRCGLFHSGFTRSNVQISWQLVFAVGFAGPPSGIVQINPALFRDAVETALDRYIGDIKDPANATLRAAFERRWDIG